MVCVSLRDSVWFVCLSASISRKLLIQASSNLCSVSVYFARKAGAQRQELVH